MLSDRHYMRDNDERSPTSILAWIVGILIAAFVVENILVRWLNPGIGHAVMQWIELSPAAIVTGKVWTLFTYGVIHDPDQLFHILGNLLGIFFLGRAVLPFLGSKRFLWLLAGAVITGGILWTGVNWHRETQLLGASAAVCALLTVFACINPHQPITLLLFFIIPVTVKPKYLAWFVLAFDSFGLLFWEIPGSAGSSVAHSAHLGGMLAGWIYFQYIHHGASFSFGGKPAIELPRWFRKTSKAKSVSSVPAYKVNIGSADDLRAEIDRILDKINSDGFQSLTAEEKQRLDHARNHLSRR